MNGDKPGFDQYFNLFKFTVFKFAISFNPFIAIDVNALATSLD